VELSDVVGSVLEQAASRLERYQVQLPAAGGKAQAAQELEDLLGRSLRLLRDLGGLRREAGRFFLRDGTEVEGRLVHLGAVASFGVSKAGGGTLAPAGGGRLRLASPHGLAAATELEAGRQPKTLPIFLYGSLDKLVEDQQKRGFRDHLRGGGPIGIIILGIGAASVLLILVRLLLLAKTSRRDTLRVDRIMDGLERGAMQQARAECEGLRGAVGRVLCATLRALARDPEKVEDVIAESVLNEQPKIERYRSALNVFAAVAPLLGLLGTVTGMISTFDVITRYGTGDPKLLSGGISEALITTEFGLFVAIPVLLVGNLLASWSDRITSDLEVTALRAVNAATAAGAGDRNAAFG
jgi:biopolymer transport protein ExbB